MKKFDNDELFEMQEVQEVINKQINPQTGKPQWKGWYMKTFYKLGREEILKLAAIARADGGNKQKHFSKLLKEALILRKD